MLWLRINNGCKRRDQMMLDTIGHLEDNMLCLIQIGPILTAPSHYRLWRKCVRFDPGQRSSQVSCRGCTVRLSPCNPIAQVSVFSALSVRQTDVYERHSLRLMSIRMIPQSRATLFCSRATIASFVFSQNVHIYVAQILFG